MQKPSADMVAGPVFDTPAHGLTVSGGFHAAAAEFTEKHLLQQGFGAPVSKDNG